MLLEMSKSIERQRERRKCTLRRNKINCQQQIKIILLMSVPEPEQGEAQLAIAFRKMSDSPLTDHSDHESPGPSALLSFGLEGELRRGLYRPAGEQCPVGGRMNRRAVSWLITVGWSRGFEQPCIWTAVLLYYAYKSHFPFAKEEMEPIILLCLQLSSKFHESAPLETRDLLLLLSRPTPRQDLSTYEERILRITDFNLVIPHYLSCLADLLDAESAAKVYFLCDLFLLRDHSIFFDRERIERMVKAVQGSSEDANEQEAEQLKEMMTGKQSRILQHKYSNKFDTDAFVSFFCATY